MSDYAIEIDDLQKSFRGKKRKTVEALKGLTLRVKRGEVFGFLGPNGAGKSTTIKILTGMIFPSSGFARVMGEDVRSPKARRSLGYLPENPAFFEFLSAPEYLCSVGRIFGLSGSALQHAVGESLALLGLDDAGKRPLRSFSKGMVQRLGLAQALLHDPELLILDEPLSGLDPLGRIQVKSLIKNLRAKGKTIFFSTHVTSDIEEICDRFAILNRGTLLEVGDVQSSLKNEVTAYAVRCSDTEEREFVRPENLSSFLSSKEASGHVILAVEPQRQSLEEHLLAVLAG